MSREISQRLSTVDPNLIWRMPPESQLVHKERGGDIRGTLVLDVDGTLTVPGRKYAIEPDTADILVEFINRGGNEIINSGATRARIERSLLNPIYRGIDKTEGMRGANSRFKRIFVMPENGSALLLSKGISVVENELSFKWYRLHELHVPDKDKLRMLIEQDLIPLIPGSFVAGDHPDDIVQREYIISWKDLEDTLGLVNYINDEVRPKRPDINWQDIELKAARTTIDFVHADSGKTISVAWVLKELAGLEGPVVGFGDLGDEFAKVIPTINVNRHKPNEFRRRGMPAMDLVNPWKILEENGYVITGTGTGIKVRDKNSDKELQVLRDSQGNVIFTQQRDDGFLELTLDGTGHPIEIKPVTYEKEGNLHEVDDAGKGTAWVIRRLLDGGYFSATK